MPPRRSKKTPSKKRGGRVPHREPRSRKPARKPPPPQLAPRENPRAHVLAQKIAQLTLDKKATEVVILDVRGKTSYTDYVVVASGESERQVSAIAEYVETTLKLEDQRPIGTEGFETGHWVLLDYGEVVAHFFYTESRSFYDLEGLWVDALRETVA